MNTLRFTAALAGIALTAAGCGSGSPSTTSTNASSSFQSITAAAFKYSRCMREHGISNFPDPHIVNRPGQQIVGLPLQPGVAATPRFKLAKTACRGIMPAPTGPNRTVGAPQQHAHMQGVLSFVRCLRSHGLSRFPDPTAQGQLTLAMVKADGVDVHAPSFLTAARACIPASHGAVTAAAIQRAVSSSP